MTINELAELMGKNRNEIEHLLRSSDVITLDLTGLDKGRVL